jgi:hypothetical protein
MQIFAYFARLYFLYFTTFSTQTAILLILGCSFTLLFFMHFVYYAIGPLAAISAIHLKRIAYFVAHLCSSSSTYFLVVLGCNPKECPHKYTHGSSGFTSFKSAIKINTFFLYLLYLHGVQIRN